MGVVRLHSANPCIRIRLLQLGHTSNEKNTHSLRVRFEPFQSYTKLTKDKKSRNALKPHTLFQHVDWTQHMIQHTESHALPTSLWQCQKPKKYTLLACQTLDPSPFFIHASHPLATIPNSRKRMGIWSYPIRPTLSPSLYYAN